MRSRFVAVGILVACGGSATGGDDNCAKDDGTCFARNLRITENGAVETPTTIGTPCNTVVSMGSDVLTTSVPGTPPVPTGGTLIDGFYVLTKREQFAGSSDTLPPPSTTTRSETMFVSNRGSTWQFLRREGAEPASRGNSVVSISGSAITIDEKCPQLQASKVADVSVLGTTIVVYETATILSTYSIAPSQPKNRPAITNKPLPINVSVKAGAPPATVELAVTSGGASCRPLLCFGMLVVRSGDGQLTAGVQSRTSSCIRGPKDAPPDGNVRVDISYGVPPQSSPQALGLQVFPATASDCATTDVAARLANGDPGVVLGEAVLVDQTITN